MRRILLEYRDGFSHAAWHVEHGRSANERMVALAKSQDF